MNKNAFIIEKGTKTEVEVVHQTAKICLVRRLGFKTERMFVFNKSHARIIDVSLHRGVKSVAVLEFQN